MKPTFGLFIPAQFLIFILFIYLEGMEQVDLTDLDEACQKKNHKIALDYALNELLLLIEKDDQILHINQDPDNNNQPHQQRYPCSHVGCEERPYKVKYAQHRHERRKHRLCCGIYFKSEGELNAHYTQRHKCKRPSAVSIINRIYP